jgi:hypothetical protein
MDHLYFTNMYPRSVVAHWFRGGKRLYQLCGATHAADYPAWRQGTHRYGDAFSVQHAGAVYRCTRDHYARTMPPPDDEAHWELLAATWYSRRRSAESLDDVLANRPRSLQGLQVHALEVLPQGREWCEFVVDLDLNDWDAPQRRDGVRSPLVLGCTPPCTGTKRVCRHCWLLAECGAHVLRVLLTDMHGLGPALAVFSGGRGLHLWWANSQARTLTATQRATLAAEFKRWGNADALDKLVTNSATNGDVARVVNAALDVWMRRGVVERQVLAGVSDPAWFASFLPPEAYAPLAAAWASTTDSVARWQAFVGIAQRCGDAFATAPLRVALEIALPVPDTSLYQPRHMLKLPFSLHKSGTGRIALPLDAEALRACDPETMPTASDVVRGMPAARAMFERATQTTAAWWNSVS